LVYLLKIELSLLPAPFDRLLEQAACQPMGQNRFILKLFDLINKKILLNLRLALSSDSLNKNSSEFGY